MEHDHNEHDKKQKMEKDNYVKLAVNLAISFVIMYAVMFLNVAEFNHIYMSLTRVYMAILMVAPMAIIMILLMGAMYKNKKMNIGIIAGSALVFILALVFLRNQTFISDRQYMKAMIPHHSSAILTSENATINNAETQKLATEIIEAQEREIKEMKQYLGEQ